MKLRATYFRGSNLDCRCRLYVTDKQDFVTDEIFSDSLVNVPTDLKKLEGSYNSVLIIRTDWSALRMTVQAIVDRINHLLTEWLNQWIPDNQDFEL